MSSLLKLVLVIIVIVGIIFIAKNQRKTNNAEQTTQTQALSEGSSDEDLSSDLTTIDAQLKAVEQGSLDIDTGLNDKPIAE